MRDELFESIRTGLAFIEASLHESIGVLDVAKSVSYSQFYFSREFSRHTHCSVYDYILKRKLTEAYKLLFRTGPKIVDLAFMFGFQSHEVFTRAFRKMFGQSPSEATVFRPLAVFEPIDGRYLRFLANLQFSLVNHPADDLCFETTGRTGSATLMHLSKENLFLCENIFKGNLSCLDSGCLSFRLIGLMHKLRIHTGDAELAFRFYFEHFYDAGELGSNYLLLVCKNGLIDILIPGRQKANFQVTGSDCRCCP